MTAATRDLGARVVEPMFDGELESMLDDELVCEECGRASAELVYVGRGLCACLHPTCLPCAQMVIESLRTWMLWVRCRDCEACKPVTEVTIETRPI